MHEYFDYTQAAEKAKISPGDLATLRKHVENIYPSRMLREMHLYTICTDIGQGKLTVAEALLPPPASGKLPDISNLRLGG
ncbi:MAG: hypothetical protein ISS69_11710 [Phycisphaerae bacterium]|nr:hypothetical protein [Phycisphaerae bacterium]